MISKHLNTWFYYVRVWSDWVWDLQWACKIVIEMGLGEVVFAFLEEGGGL
jgi:hypothetical protein